MKKMVTREIEICEVCGREEATYESCIVCGKDMCLSCENTAIAGCVVSSIPGTCRKCSKREDVLAIFEKWAPKIQAVRKARDDELMAFGAAERA